MKQVGHSESIVQHLDDENIQERLEAMLSHSDGIRGFFVTYLTLQQPSAGIPDSLLKAMNTVDEKELVPLACMNVVMPTAMITMHQDAELSDQSRTTAERGLAVLLALSDKALVQRNVRAIAAVAEGRVDADIELVEYWTTFFEKWGYQELQKRDIAQAMKALLP